ncbi:MAG TPA: S41 family peptidase [Pseudogracilibacillus sp.]|nr:S41 family peptidase [Pseudogracilibacillus sp.]
MNIRKHQLVVMLVMTFAIGFFVAILAVNTLKPSAMKEGPPTEIVSESDRISFEESLENVKMAYDLINEYYFEEVDSEELLEGAIQGMLEKLDDPYSSYMNEEAMKRFNEQIESSFQGIGAEVSMVDDTVTIIAPIKDSPAEKAGLRSNDQILKVDGEPLDGLDLNEAVEKIRGEKGTEVVLLIKRQGASEPFEVTVVRDDIPVITVESEIETVDGKKTGIIEISTFSEETAKEFAEALDELESKGIEGLVIDVRGNPGGLLHSIEEILQHFIPKDVPYLQTEDRSGNREKFYTNLDEKKPYPISVLIDEGSASASEILAVAMKEIGYDVVGKTSFGKGTVQQAIPLTENRNGSTIKLTFYKWLSPEGNWINEVGVEPTVEQSQPEFYYGNPIVVEEKPLQLDDAGEQVENAQVLLDGIGYNPIRKDGYFDEEMKKQVEAFQKDQGLDVTGKIDSETAGAIEREAMEQIREGTQDLQKQKALEVLYK